METTGIPATMIEAEEAEMSLTPLFSRKKYSVTPSSPERTRVILSAASSLNPGSRLQRKKRSRRTAIRNLAKARLMGGMTATDTFMLTKLNPQSNVVTLIERTGRNLLLRAFTSRIKAM